MKILKTRKLKREPSAQQPQKLRRWHDFTHFACNHMLPEAQSMPERVKKTTFRV